MVVDPILAGLVRIVKRGEGHVGAFAGDALLCYFGAPVAHEDDADACGALRVRDARGVSGPVGRRPPRRLPS